MKLGGIGVLETTRIRRNSGYNILINLFEENLREYIANEVLIYNYGQNWKQQIPKGVKDQLVSGKGIIIDQGITIHDYFEELNFLHLKDILIFDQNYQYARNFLGTLSKTIFIELMDELNIYRRKIAHA